MYKDATSVSYRNGIVLRRRLEKESPETYEDGSNEIDVGIPNYKYRTHNRNRSLSFINSDQQVNVNKGSRQIKPVTLGKKVGSNDWVSGAFSIDEYNWMTVTGQPVKLSVESILETCDGQLEHFISIYR